MDLKTHYIYGLKDPITGEIKYVGKTGDPAKRLKEHLRDGGNIQKFFWIKELEKQNLQPSMEIIDVCDLNDVDAKEEKYVEEYLKKNELFNVALTPKDPNIEHCIFMIKKLGHRIPKDLDSYSKNVEFIAEIASGYVDKLKEYFKNIAI
jgi:hypothetical protein